MSLIQPQALIINDVATGKTRALQALFAEKGFHCDVADSLTQARDAIDQHMPDVVLLQPQLPDGDGLTLLSDKSFVSSAEIFLISDDTDAQGQITDLPLNTAHPVATAMTPDELSDIIADVARDIRQQIAIARVGEPPLAGPGRLRGHSASMRKLYRAIRKVAPTPASVLICGESGTGKELIAEAIHQHSGRAGQSYETMNCGAIPAELLESELFGHEKGAFSGAVKAHTGYFERAHGGTLFLDEITEMPPELQVRLLRVLERHSLRRVGGEEDITVDVRIVAATNRDPEQAIRDGRLREDLFFRLCQFPLQIPPLRHRPEDIEELAINFVHAMNRQYETTKTLTHAALEKMRHYHWPGNVRELRNLVERSYILADNAIDADQLELGLFPGSSDTAAPGHASVTVSGDAVKIPIGTPLEAAERTLLLATLKKNRGNKKLTARELGISLKTLYNRLETYNEKQ